MTTLLATTMVDGIVWRCQMARPASRTQQWPAVGCQGKDLATGHFAVACFGILGKCCFDGAIPHSSYMNESAAMLME
jgi:hypothetical protein